MVSLLFGSLQMATLAAVFWRETQMKRHYPTTTEIFNPHQTP